MVALLAILALGVVLLVVVALIAGFVADRPRREAQRTIERSVRLTLDARVRAEDESSRFLRETHTYIENRRPTQYVWDHPYE